MRTGFGLLASALLASTAFPALAADLIIDTPADPVVIAPSQGPSTGFYVEGHAGSAMIGVQDTDLTDNPVQTQDWSKPNLTAGIAFGWDTVLSGNLVGGVDLRYDFFNADFVPYEDAGLGTIFTFKDTASAVGKLGYQVVPGTQIYAVLGFGSAGVEAAEGFDGFATGRANGWVGGIGAEARISDLISATIDARYFSAFDKFTTEDEEEFLPRYLAVTVGLKYRFDDGSGASAVAADPIDFNFTGPSIGVSLMAAAASMQRAISAPGAETGPFYGEGAGIGGSLGYDFALNDDWVLGVLAGIDYHPITFYDDSADSPDVEGTTEFANIDSVVAIGGRIGAKLNSQTLVYGKLAYAAIHTTANDDFFALGGGGEEWLSGTQIGVGIETAISDSVTVGIEGTYTRASEALVTENTQLEQVELTPSILAAKATLKYHF
jgi:opacity protein-like surface antigen